MSKEVKRYDYGYVDDGNGNRYLGLIEKPDGNLVKHEDYKALLDERDAEWISAETLPACPDAEITFEAKEYLVTNGYTVGICDFQRGHGCGKPWAAWGNYGSLKPSEITHWKLFPVPPALQGAQP